MVAITLELIVVVVPLTVKLPVITASLLITRLEPVILPVALRLAALNVPPVIKLPPVILPVTEIACATSIVTLFADALPIIEILLPAVTVSVSPTVVASTAVPFA